MLGPISPFLSSQASQIINHFKNFSDFSPTTKIGTGIAIAGISMLALKVKPSFKVASSLCIAGQGITWLLPYLATRWAQSARNHIQPQRCGQLHNPDPRDVDPQQRPKNNQRSPENNPHPPVELNHLMANLLNIEKIVEAPHAQHKSRRLSDVVPPNPPNGHPARRADEECQDPGLAEAFPRFPEKNLLKAPPPLHPGINQNQSPQKFYEIDPAGEERKEIPHEFLVNLGNRDEYFHAGNLIMMILSQTKPTNPWTTQRIEENYLNHLADMMGIDANKFKNIWNEVHRNPRAQHIDPEIKADLQVRFRFRALNDLLQSEQNIPPHIQKKRQGFLEFFNQEEQWISFIHS